MNALFCHPICTIAVGIGHDIHSFTRSVRCSIAAMTSICEQDVSGSYMYEFPGMRNVSLSSADAFIIVFALDDYSTWEEASRLRDMVHEAKDCAADNSVPIVVVGNKCEVEKHDGDILKETPEATVVFDWENGYVESSAKERRNINKIFKELLVQARSRYDFGGGGGGGGGQPADDSKQSPDGTNAAVACGSPASRHGQGSEAMRRRQSLPAVPVGFLLSSAAASHLVSVGEEDENGSSSSSKKHSIRD